MITGMPCWRISRMQESGAQCFDEIGKMTLGEDTDSGTSHVPGILVIVWIDILEGTKMKRPLLLATLMALYLTACGNKTAEKPAGEQPISQAPAAAPAIAMPPGHPALPTGNMGQSAPLPPLTHKGIVLSTLNVTQYTYLEVKEANDTRWLATTTSPAKKGDAIQFDEGMTMHNFNSKMLNRVFPSITFVGRLVIDNGQS